MRSSIRAYGMGEPAAPGVGRPRTPARRNRIGRVAAGVLLAEIVVALLAPTLAPHDALEQDTTWRLKPPLTVAAAGRFILGSDQLGRDVLSRILHGARISLLIGISAVAIAAPLGVAVGLFASYHGRALDDVVMRIADVQLAFPFILLAVTVVAVLGPSVRNLIIVLGIAGWVPYARLARSEVLTLRGREFVEAARALGATKWRQVVRHILPNSLGPVIVAGTVDVAAAIIAESTLSFLGLGFPPDIPTWGRILYDAKDYLDIAPHWALVAGAAIFLAVLSINFVGDGLRDALDPRKVM
jgi:peptide/nickel transport system permease protein